MAHNSTIFGQLLKLLPRHEFEALAGKHKAGRMPRKLTRWDQFVAMGMAQLTGRCSLRDIVSNLSAQSRKLYHLGVGEVSRSSLARVNAEKPWQLYQALFGVLLPRCQLASPGHGFRFKNPLYSLDSTVIDLCLAMFPWAKFRRTKGGVKAHVALDHAGHLPAFMTVTDARTSDIEAARALRLPKGSIVAADRAYMDFAWHVPAGVPREVPQPPRLQARRNPAPSAAQSVRAETSRRPPRKTRPRPRRSVLRKPR